MADCQLPRRPFTAIRAPLCRFSPTARHLGFYPIVETVTWSYFNFGFFVSSLTAIAGSRQFLENGARPERPGGG